MPTSSNPASPSRSTTGRVPGTKSVRVWGEVAITVNLGDYNNIKMAFGHERMCLDNDEAIARCERQIYKRNSEVVSRRAEEAARLVKSMLGES